MYRWLRLAVAAAVFLASRQGAPAAPQGYADPSACRSCHQAIYDDYQQTPMGRSFFLPAAGRLLGDWEQNNRFYHQPSNRYYEMILDAGRPFVRRYQLDDQGRRINFIEKQVTHIMGSGERAQSYLHQSPDGRIIELPVAWYSQEQSWGMAPGYDRKKHAGFTRQVNHKCMFCHNGYPDAPGERARQGWDADVRFPQQLPLGIDCQRCHGPGAEHVRAALEPQPPQTIRNAIVNPARLSPARQLDVCMQCHLETTTFRLPESYRRFGRPFYSYRPGEPLGDYIVHFDHAPGTGHDDKFEIVSAAYRLRQSACFEKSGAELTCTVCHDPHRRVSPDQRASHYRARCLGCHDATPALRDTHTGLGENMSESNCVACHMPSRRTEDVVHVVMTDHRIARRKPDRDLLAPLREKTDQEQRYQGEVVLYFSREGLPAAVRDLYLGIAQVKEKANLSAGLPLLAEAVRRQQPPQPEPYFEWAEAQAASGDRQGAIENFRQALDRDPAFVQAHNNLANLLADQRRYKEAIGHYRRALELDPGSADIGTNLGLALLDSGDGTGAIEAFRAAAASHQTYPEAHFNLGSALLAQGQVNEAYDALATALAIEPAHAKANHNMGLALLALGRRQEAVWFLRVAIAEGDEALRASAERYLREITTKNP
jgi:predicted CXXCH cytochrome family protein